MQMTSEETTKRLHQFFEAWNGGEADDIATHLAESVTLHPPRSLGKPVEGRAAAAAVFSGAAAAQFLDLETISRVLDSLIVDGPNAAAVFSLEADLVAGGSYRNTYCWVFTCADDLIATATEFTDTNHAVRTFRGR